MPAPASDAAMRWGDVGLTLSLAAAGGVIFALLGAPAAFLSGAAVATTALTLTTQRSVVPAHLRDLCYLILGVSMGSGITPEALQGIARWPLSIAVLMLTIPLIVGSSGLFLTRVMGWKPEEAFLASVPGALQHVVATAEHAGLDVPRVAIAQTLRLVLMVALLPSLMVGSGMAAGQVRASPGVADLATVVLLGTAGCAASLLLGRIRMPAPLLMGGLLASAILHASGLVASQLPAAITLPAMVVVGAVIGSRFAGADLATVRRVVVGSLGGFLIALAVSAVIAAGVAVTLGLPFAQTLLAFAPGGIDASIVMAYAMGLEPAFVAAHQLSRFLAIAFVLPLIFTPVAAWLAAPEGVTNDDRSTP